MSSEEICAQVDEFDNLVGPVARSKLRSDHLLHRATYIFLFNSKHRAIYVHKRTLTKDYCPGFWDLAAGGVVQFGESYEENAVRELFEEYGVSVPLEFIDTRFSASERVWGGIFLGYWEGNVDEMRPQPEEVERIELLGVDRIFEKEQVTPDSLEMLRHLLNLRKL